MVLLVKSKRSLLLPFAACILQAALTCAYPTKEVVQLENPGEKEGGDGGCLPGTHCECKYYCLLLLLACRYAAGEGGGVVVVV